MPETPEQWLVAAIGKIGRQFLTRFITEQEFTSKVLDLFADSRQVYPAIVPDLWELIPEMAQAEFVKALRSATLPDFTYHAFEMGGGRGLTEEERQSQQARNAKRVQTWAIVMLQFLDADSANSRTQP